MTRIEIDSIISLIVNGINPNGLDPELVIEDNSELDLTEVVDLNEPTYPLLNTHLPVGRERFAIRTIADDAVVAAQETTRRYENELEGMLLENGRLDPLTSAQLRGMNWLHPRFDVGTIWGIWNSENIEDQIKELVQPSLWAKGADTRSVVIIERKPQILAPFDDKLVDSNEDARAHIDPQTYHEALKSLRTICSDEAQKRGLILSPPINGHDILPRGLRAWVAVRRRTSNKSHK